MGTRGKQGDEAIAAIQVRDDGGLDQSGIGGDEKWLNSWCVEQIAFTDNRFSL